MRGHEPIVQARLQGLVPAWVLVNDYPCPTDWTTWGDVPTVCVDQDPIDRLDLRFLVGVKVSVTSPDLARVQALFQKIRAAGASLVGAGHIQADKHWFDQTGWAAVYFKDES